MLEQVSEAAGESTLDLRHRNIVSTMGYPLGHPKPGHFRAGQREIDQLDPPARGLQSLDKPQITTPGQRRLEAEVPVGLDVALDFPKEDAPGRHPFRLRRQRRHARRDQIGISRPCRG